MVRARGKRVQHPSGVDIPTLPSTLAEVLHLRRQGQKAAAQQRLVAIIERDAVTSAFVLKRVNSAYHGLARNVSQIDRAVTLLGFLPVCNIVFTQSLRQTFGHLRNTKVGEIYGHIMKTSTAAAAFGRELALRLHPDVPDTTFAAGLLHQLGRLVLLAAATERYGPLWYSSDGRGPVEPLVPEERRRLRTDYVRIGMAVGLRWELPDAIVTVIQHHERPADVQNERQRAITHFVAAGRHAAVALYDRHRTGESAFFGLSPVLVALARTHGVDPRDLVAMMVERRSAIRSYADGILG